MKLLGFIDE